MSQKFQSSYVQQHASDNMESLQCLDTQNSSQYFDYKIEKPKNINIDTQQLLKQKQSDLSERLNKMFLEEDQSRELPQKPQSSINKKYSENSSTPTKNQSGLFQNINKTEQQYNVQQSQLKDFTHHKKQENEQQISPQNGKLVSLSGNNQVQQKVAGVSEKKEDINAYKNYESTKENDNVQQVSLINQKDIHQQSYILSKSDKQNILNKRYSDKQQILTLMLEVPSGVDKIVIENEDEVPEKAKNFCIKHNYSYECIPQLMTSIYQQMVILKNSNSSKSNKFEQIDHQNNIMIQYPLLDKNSVEKNTVNEKQINSIGSNNKITQINQPNIQQYDCSIYNNKQSEQIYEKHEANDYYQKNLLNYNNSEDNKIKTDQDYIRNNKFITNNNYVEKSDINKNDVQPAKKQLFYNIYDSQEEALSELYNKKQQELKSYFKVQPRNNKQNSENSQTRINKKEGNLQEYDNSIKKKTKKWQREVSSSPITEPENQSHSNNKQTQKPSSPTFNQESQQNKNEIYQNCLIRNESFQNNNVTQKDLSNNKMIKDQSSGNLMKDLRDQVKIQKAESSANLNRQQESKIQDLIETNAQNNQKKQESNMHNYQQLSENQENKILRSNSPHKVLQPKNQDQIDLDQKKQSFTNSNNIQVSQILRYPNNQQDNALFNQAIKKSSSGLMNNKSVIQPIIEEIQNEKSIQQKKKRSISPFNNQVNISTNSKNNNFSNITLQNNQSNQVEINHKNNCNTGSNLQNFTNIMNTNNNLNSNIYQKNTQNINLNNVQISSSQNNQHINQINYQQNNQSNKFSNNQSNNVIINNNSNKNLKTESNNNLSNSQLTKNYQKQTVSQQNRLNQKSQGSQSRSRSPIAKKKSDRSLSNPRKKSLENPNITQKIKVLSLSSNKVVKNTTQPQNPNSNQISKLNQKKENKMPDMENSSQDIRGKRDNRCITNPSINSTTPIKEKNNYSRTPLKEQTSKIHNTDASKSFQGTLQTEEISFHPQQNDQSKKVVEGNRQKGITIHERLYNEAKKELKKKEQWDLQLKKILNKNSSSNINPNQKKQLKENQQIPYFQLKSVHNNVKGNISKQKDYVMYQNDSIPFKPKEPEQNKRTLNKKSEVSQENDEIQDKLGQSDSKTQILQTSENQLQQKQQTYSASQNQQFQFSQSLSKTNLDNKNNNEPNNCISSKIDHNTLVQQQQQLLKFYQENKDNNFTIPCFNDEDNEAFQESYSSQRSFKCQEKKKSLTDMQSKDNTPSNLLFKDQSVKNNLCKIENDKNQYFENEQSMKQEIMKTLPESIIFRQKSENMQKEQKKSSPRYSCHDQDQEIEQDEEQLEIYMKGIESNNEYLNSSRKNDEAYSNQKRLETQLFQNQLKQQQLQEEMQMQFNQIPKQDNYMKDNAYQTNKSKTQDSLNISQASPQNQNLYCEKGNDYNDERIKKVLDYIFFALDSDNDGYISTENIDLSKLNTQILLLIKDVLLDVEILGILVDYKCFCALVMKRKIEQQLLDYIFNENSMSPDEEDIILSTSNNSLLYLSQSKQNTQNSNISNICFNQESIQQKEQFYQSTKKNRNMLLTNESFSTEHFYEKKKNDYFDFQEYQQKLFDLQAKSNSYDFRLEQKYMNNQNQINSDERCQENQSSPQFKGYKS